MKGFQLFHGKGEGELRYGDAQVTKGRGERIIHQGIKRIIYMDIKITTHDDRDGATENGRETGAQILENKSESRAGCSTAGRQCCKA